MKTKTQSVNIVFEGRPLELKLPASWQVLKELKPSSAQPLDDIESALRQSLESPIGCEALSSEELSQKKILIVVDDFSRPTPVATYFGEFLDYLSGLGATKDNMLVLTALGIHRDMTQAEIEEKLGADNLKGLRWINHQPKQVDANIDLGQTTRGTRVLLNKHLSEADLIFCLGAIEPHLLLGFGGGLKMLLPGVAHEQTIAQNHMQGVSFEKYNYIGELESPMRLDLEEAVQKLEKPIFIVNAIMNEKLEVCRFVCGDPIEAHREGAALAKSINACPIGELADVALVVSNPMNADLRQGMKCIGNAEQSIKKNGLIIGFLECQNGVGDVALPPRSLPNGLLRFILRLLGPKRILWFIDKVKKDAGIEERFIAHFSMQVVRKNKIMIHSGKLPLETGKQAGLFLQFPDPESLLKAAARYAPRRAKVYICPHGGVTYPELDG